MRPFYASPFSLEIEPKAFRNRNELRLGLAHSAHRYRIQQVLQFLQPADLFDNSKHLMQVTKTAIVFASSPTALI